jgi:hypothetical protein
MANTLENNQLPFEGFHWPNMTFCNQQAAQTGVFFDFL